MNVDTADPSRPDLATVVDVEPILVRQLVAALRRQQGDPEVLLRGLGFAAEDLEAPEFRVSYAQTSRVIRRALRSLPSPTLAFELGARASPASWGPSLVGMLACATVREMLEFALDFQPCTKRLLSLRGEVHGERLTVFAETLHPDEDEIATFLVQCAFAQLLGAARFAAGGALAPVQARLALPADQAAAVAQLMQCEVEVVEPGALPSLVFTGIGEAIATADPVVARQVRRGLTLTRSRGDLRSELEEAIVRVARENLRSPPSAETFAASMNLSERTLRRRLQENGTSFATLIDQERRRAVTAMLRDLSRPYVEIAEATGFADVRSLRRAFKRWTGLTPSQARQPGPSDPR